MLDQQINMYLGEGIQLQRNCASKVCKQPSCEFHVTCHPSVGGLCDPVESLNDIAVFGHSVFSYRANTSQGLFASGCLKPSLLPWVKLRKAYTIKQKTGIGELCPDDSDSHISPFNVGEYVIHFTQSANSLAGKRQEWNEQNVVLPSNRKYERSPYWKTAFRT